MKFKLKLFSAIVSIAIALITLYFLEHKGYGKSTQHFFFGDIADGKQLEKLEGEDFYKNIKKIMLLIFAFFVTYACFFVFFFEIIALVYFLVTSKWRKPRVFISYKNADAGSKVNTGKIAEDINADLKHKGFRTLFTPFNKKMDHDNVNLQNQNKLRKADAMVVIPDPYHSSYVNSEIFSAVTLYKPVYIIKHTNDQKLPDTANSGHTVLLLDKLKKEKYTPLSDILQYVHKVWHQRLFIIAMPFTTFLSPFIYLDEGIGNMIKTLLIFGLLTVGFVYFDLQITTMVIVVKIIITLIGIVGVYITLIEIFKNIRLQKVIKQSMINAGKPYDYFKEAGFDKKTLDCVDKVGLEKFKRM